MSKKLSEKLMGLLGFEVEEMEEDFTPEEEDEIHEPALFRPRAVKNNVVNIHSAQNIRIVVANAARFEQVQEYATELKNRRPVIINLEGVDRETGRRILDFMSGATYALGGLMRKVSSNIFLFAPSNVDIDWQHPLEKSLERTC